MINSHINFFLLVDGIHYHSAWYRVCGKLFFVVFFVVVVGIIELSTKAVNKPTLNIPTTVTLCISPYLYLHNETSVILSLSTNRLPANIST